MRLTWLDTLAQVCQRFNWVYHAYCQMTNHYHLLIETPDANLPKGMRQLNGVYTQRFNRNQGRVGHVFHGRFKAILVDKDSYLLELAGYVVFAIALLASFAIPAWFAQKMGAPKAVRTAAPGLARTGASQTLGNGSRENQARSLWSHPQARTRC